MYTQSYIDVTDITIYTYYYDYICVYIYYMSDNPTAWGLTDRGS